MIKWIKQLFCGHPAYYLVRHPKKADRNTLACAVCGKVGL